MYLFEVVLPNQHGLIAKSHSLGCKETLWNPNESCMWGSPRSRRKKHPSPVWKEPSPMMTRCIQLRIAMATGREHPRSLSWPGAGGSLFQLSTMQFSEQALAPALEFSDKAKNICNLERVSFQSGLPWPVLWSFDLFVEELFYQPKVATCDWLSMTHRTFWVSFWDHNC